MKPCDTVERLAFSPAWHTPYKSFDTCTVIQISFPTEIAFTCFYSEECLLPCQSTYYNIIHWYKGQKAVHSFYQGKDQLSYQAGEYKGRTSLLTPSEIKKGNVSLLLKNIQIQDEGKYKCYGASDTLNEENFVLVSVEGEKQYTLYTLKQSFTSVTEQAHVRGLSLTLGAHSQTICLKLFSDNKLKNQREPLLGKPWSPMCFDLIPT